MNRIIKFRAWDKEKKEMYNSQPNMFWDREGNLTYPPKEIWELMQFTGLKDKNGKEIYEGDIVKIGRSYQVSWDEKYLRWGVISEGVKEKFDFLWQDWKGGVEVIGNIFETPSLIKKL